MEVGVVERDGGGGLGGFCLLAAADSREIHSDKPCRKGENR